MGGGGGGGADAFGWTHSDGSIHPGCGVGRLSGRRGVSGWKFQPYFFGGEG